MFSLLETTVWTAPKHYCIGPMIPNSKKLLSFFSKLNLSVFCLLVHPYVPMLVYDLLMVLYTKEHALRVHSASKIHPLYTYAS
jgi:hypothetical protein